MAFGTQRNVARTKMQARSTSTNFNDPKAISEAGEKIYERLYKAEYERSYLGKFVAINILDDSATIGNNATEALGSARAKYPKGLFHLIRVGHSGAFEVGLAHRHVSADRIR
jgi:hypothetical protein